MFRSSFVLLSGAEACTLQPFFFSLCALLTRRFSDWGLPRSLKTKVKPPPIPISIDWCYCSERKLLFTLHGWMNQLKRRPLASFRRIRDLLLFTSLVFDVIEKNFENLDKIRFKKLSLPYTFGCQGCGRSFRSLAIRRPFTALFFCLPLLSRLSARDKGYSHSSRRMGPWDPIPLA